jgi:hypothetical protein
MDYTLKPAYLTEIYAPKDRVKHYRTSEISTLQIGAVKNSIDEVCISEVRTSKASSAEILTLEVCPG